VKKILLIGQFTDISGYGNAVRCYLSNLIELENEGLIDLKILNYSFEEKIGASEQELEEIKKRSLTKSLLHRSGMCDDEAEYARVQEYMDGGDYEVIMCLTSDMLGHGEDNNKSKFIVDIPGYPEHNGPRFNIRQICRSSRGVNQCIAWESDSIPLVWRDSILDKSINVKKLICTCDWNRDTFSELGIESVTIPFSMNFEENIDEEYYKKVEKVTKDKFVFSSVFQWSPRKGTDILLKAFALEFARNDDVCLIMKTYLNKAFVGAAQKETAEFKKQIKIINSSLLHLNHRFVPKFKTVIINDILTKKQLNSIYKRSDAFVLPTRGEGFCLPAAEAISCETPAIMPNIGGHLGYMDTSDNNRLLIDSRMEPCENMHNHLWSSIDIDWVEPSLKSTREKIRFAYENRETCKTIGKEQNTYMRNYLSKERCVSLFKKHLL